MPVSGAFDAGVGFADCGLWVLFALVVWVLCWFGGLVDCADLVAVGLQLLAFGGEFCLVWGLVVVVVILRWWLWTLMLLAVGVRYAGGLALVF